jgi:hypothetical protein
MSQKPFSFKKAQGNQEIVLNKRMELLWFLDLLYKTFIVKNFQPQNRQMAVATV